MTRAIRHGTKAITTLTWCFALAACAAGPNIADAAAENAAPPPRAGAYVPLQLPANTQATPSPPAPPTVGAIYPGSGNFLGSNTGVKPAAVTGDGDITLNFVNADVRDVAKAILGDYLKFNYEIGAGVQGAVTIQTSEPLTRTQVLPVFESILQLNGMALVDANGIYRIVPAKDARLASGAIRRSGSDNAPLGYGVEIVPLKFVAAAEMQKLLDPLAPAQGIIHSDTARNLLIIEGTQEQRQTLLDNIALFDADWLSGMSFALYTPRYTDAEKLSAELTQVLGGEASPIAGVVRLMPIARLNAVLAISPQTQYLERLATWVARLDRPGEGSDRRIYVYRVQNGRAADLAATLNKVMSGFAALEPGRTAAPAGDTRAAPGGGVAAGALGSINVTADENNNALVILATPQEYTATQAALQELDSAPIQVFLEAAIAEVTLTDDLRYGVQYFYQNGDYQTVLSTSRTSSIAPVFPGYSFIFSQGTDIRIVLDQLASKTRVEVVSSPKLLVLNNQTATLQVGDRVPIVTEQATSVVTPNAPVVNSVQYADTGVILRVTPRVNRGGIVMMDVSQEVSDVTSTTSSAINSPTIQQRKVSSSIAVQNGETVALGGLITDNTNKIKGGIPFVQDVPLLGAFFRSTDNAKDRTELMVLITPHVIDSTEKARNITSELRRRLPAIQTLFEKTF